MPATHKPQRRSSCPVNASLEIIGDRMLRSYRTYKELLSSDEGIATNILAERLKRLEAAGIISTSRDAEDRRKVVYRLTAKGIDLTPIIVELILWGAQHEPTGAPPAAIRKMRAGRQHFLSEIRRNWEEGGTAVFIASARKA